MNIKFIPVNQKNIEQVEKLHISEAQKGSCETVRECFDEALIFQLWRPVAIMIDNELVGFAMYGLWLYEGDHGKVWLDRFFIDENHQGKGYSKAVLPVLINHIVSIYNYDELYLSVYEDNAIAIHLYEQLGFVFNGELDINGEKVMVLKV